MSSLKDILTRETKSLAQLLAVLQNEYAALTQADTRAVDAATSNKQRLIAEIEELEKLRQTVLIEAGFHRELGDIERYIASLGEPQQGDLQRLWSNLTAAASACRDQNAVNGNIIEVRRRHAQQGLAILCGQAAGNDLYDPSGKPVFGQANYRLVKA